jgi:hypothetical protein
MILEALVGLTIGFKHHDDGKTNYRNYSPQQPPLLINGTESVPVPVIEP